MPCTQHSAIAPLLERMDDSPQVKSIEQYTNTIAMLISGNLTLIANDLRELLDDMDYSRIVSATATPPLQRANDLIQCVITQVKVDPAKYQVFYGVIKKYRTLQVLLKKLPEPDVFVHLDSMEERSRNWERDEPDSGLSQQPHNHCRSVKNDQSSERGSNKEEKTAAGPVPPRRMETDSEIDPELYEKPNLVNLISFPGRRDNINIPQQISAKYFMFGVLLLNDKTGAEVSTIDAKYHGDAEQINLEILRLWIGGRGKPLSWDILLGVLEEIGLGNLAGDIKNGLQ